MGILFIVADPRGFRIALTEEVFGRHILPRHPEATEDAIRECVIAPEKITHDPSFMAHRHVYHRAGRYGADRRPGILRVIVDMRDDRKFGRYDVVTAFMSGHPSPEEVEIWKDT